MFVHSRGPSALLFWSIWQKCLKCDISTWETKQKPLVFSAPEPKAQVHHYDQALSVVRSSVIRPPLTFHIFDFSSEIQRNLIGSKCSTSSTNFVFFWPIGKTRWPPWPLIGWEMFDFSSESAERNSTKLYRKQDLNVLYQVCVFFWADRKNKMVTLASDWLRHFRLLWNRLMEFNETWQEARSQRPLPSMCF